MRRESSKSEPSPPSGERSHRALMLEIIRRIPYGRVATYGDIAHLAGIPRAAREVGRALRHAPKGDPVPWWRVVNRLGQISCRSHGMDLQAQLLREEGVEVGEDGGLDLERYRWSDPGSDAEPPAHPVPAPP